MDGSNGPVIGWTNETEYGGIGQKVILTFQSSTSGSASLTEFTARGQRDLSIMLKIGIIFIAAFKRGMTAPDRLGERATALESMAFR